MGGSLKLSLIWKSDFQNVHMKISEMFFEVIKFWSFGQIVLRLQSRAHWITVGKEKANMMCQVIRNNLLHLLILIF